MPLGVAPDDWTATEAATVPLGAIVPKLRFTEAPDVVAVTRIGGAETPTADVAFPGNALKA